MSKLTIGLFGFGCVGQGLYNILERSQHESIGVKKIVVKNPEKDRPLPRQRFSFHPDDILKDGEINVVVELIDDADAAFAILKSALQNGKHVVTANKKMLAENLEEIVHLQRRYNRSVLYEAAVCGSIPIIRSLEEYYAHEEISSVEGIFNGSTNYILTRVLEERLSYAEALNEARRLGFAETDPTLDVEGLDPRYKLSIVLLHAFGVVISPERIPVSGITRMGREESEFAQKNSLSLRLCAHAVKQDDKVFAWVMPQFIPLSHHLAHTRLEYNAVQITGEFAGRQLLTGKGAGSMPTALAVLSDIIALQNNYRYPLTKRKSSKCPLFSTNISLNAWVRFDGNQAITWTVFNKVFGGYANAGCQVIVGELALDTIAYLAQQEGVHVVLLPEDFKITSWPAASTEIRREAAVACVQ